jgi:hypothetical protein
MSKEQLITGLKSGRAIYIDREDAPELNDLEELQKQGLLEIVIIQVGEVKIAKFWMKSLN